MQKLEERLARMKKERALKLQGDSKAKEIMVEPAKKDMKGVTQQRDVKATEEKAKEVRIKRITDNIKVQRAKLENTQNGDFGL